MNTTAQCIMGQCMMGRMLPWVVATWANRVSPVLMTARHSRRAFPVDVRITTARA